MAEAKKTRTPAVKAEAKTKTVKKAKKIEAIDSEVKTEESVVASSTEPAEQAETAEVKLAKAGRRSAKALKEAEAEAARLARKTKAADEPTPDKTKPQQKPPRSRLERRGKNYKKAAELLEKDKIYSLKEALPVLIITSPVKFDASVEMHVNLNVDPRQADQNIRGSVALPAGTGKGVRITVLAEAADAAKALKAGADIAGEEQVLNDLEKGVFDFDVLITVPAMMSKLGKYARVLGPKGLMPNPKSGTVTIDVAKAVTEAKAGRVEYRVDSTGIIHLAVGKVSFGADKLESNITAVLSAIKAAKPSSLKGGVFVKTIHLTTSMGPSLKISSAEA